jgi:hypothetical protein
MMISKMKKVFYVFFLGMLMISCSKQKEKDADSESRAFEVERENFFNSLKDPDEVANRLMPGLSEFDSTVLSVPENFFQHATSDIKAAANLGVYIADMNYCILFRQSAYTKKYFNAAWELGKVIRIEKGVLEFLMKRYQTNIEQNDSVKSVVQHLFEQSTSGLQGTDRERLAGIAMAGYQIENLYLVLSTLESLPETLTDEQTQTQKELLNYVLEQQGKFDVIYNFIRANSDPLDPNQNPNYPYFDNALRELIGVYRSVTTSDPKIKELGEKVNAIRNKIISM